ncbi:MAG: helix-turn-helix domain-containing protein, partial [Lachnospiraceae bacterium]|nr:helix-turn-helix domain-containing protein [Lachnospiraceae bacterium]
MNNARQGYNQSDIVLNNRTRLLQILCREGVCPRVRLARQTGLNQSTVTNITAEFIRWGLVRETGFMTGSKGRRSIGISLNNDDFGILSIRLART